MSETDFRQARFLKSAAALTDLPADRGCEVAFAGRSNAGKSSALNALTGVSGLARVSKTPGRTRLINLFDLGSQRRLVDLPGYGYARVPVAERERWAGLLEAYFTRRGAYGGLMLVMDIRHPLTEFDRLLLDFASPLGRPVHVLLSKADKLGRGAAAAACKSVERSLGGRAGVQLFSALSGEGVERARRILADWFAQAAEKNNPGAKGGKHRG